MRVALSILALMALVVVAYAGSSTAWWNIDDARVASKIEIKMGMNGDIVDAEYHVEPDMVPPAVTAAMEALYPGLDPVAAEREIEGGGRFYELSVMAATDPENPEVMVKVEAMFTAEGELHSQEIETQTDNPTYPVPQEVQDAIAAKYGSGTVDAWEVILDAGGQVVEYHVKLTEPETSGEKHYKLIVTPTGYIKDAYLEVVAELEVPMPPR